MTYQMNLGAWNQVFAVPAEVVDQHLRLAGSAQLKVLLWLLRHAGAAQDAERIGEALGLSRADVCDAMQYWIHAGLIVADGEELKPSTAEPTVRQEAVPIPETPLPTDPKPTARTKPRMLNAGEIAQRINGSDELRFMLDTAEEIFGRPLSTPENGAILAMHDYDGIPADVVILMIQYAFDQNKCNIRYIEKMALSWAEQGIDSHEKAEAYIRLLDERKNAWNRVRTLFGIADRKPSSSEEAYVQQWLNEWHFSEDMLREAYDRCVDATGKMQFRYINSILERWYKEGIMTVGDALREKESDASPKTKAHPKEQNSEPSYDIEAFEKSLYDGNEV